MQLTSRDLQLIDRLHGGFPISERPYQDVAVEMGWSEMEVIERLQALLDAGVLTRFGPLFQIERAGGLFVLAALAAPEERFEAIAELVNQFPEVAHNYRREHALNMWFVVAAESPTAARDVMARIESVTGCVVLAFPKEREFFVELRLPVLGGAV